MFFKNHYYHYYYHHFFLGGGVLVIALCLFNRLFALFVFIFQIVLEFLRSVQVLHTLCSYTLLCLITVGLI